MAEMLSAKLRAFGARAEVVPTAGHPVVFGELDMGAERTLLVYGMYDTMPADPEKWTTDPFAANIVDVEGLGPSVIARGAVNQKGPLSSFLNMLDSWLAVHRHFARELQVLTRR